MQRYYKTIEELKNYTTIDVTSKSLNEIIEFLDKNKNETDSSDFGFPFTEGVIICKLNQELFRYYYFKIEGKKESINIEIESYFKSNIFNKDVFIGESALTFNMCNDRSVVKSLDIKDIQYNKSDKIINEFRKNKVIKTKKDLMNDVSYVLNILMYINIVRKNRTVVYKEKKGLTYKSSNTKKNKSSEKRVQILNNDKVMYTITGKDDVVSSYRNYSRQKESWAVIGHYRHYRNGLIKWIDSYMKGKGKNSTNNYKIK